MTVDRNGVALRTGARVKYYLPGKKSSTRTGTILHDTLQGDLADVVLDGDPFGCYVPQSRIEFAGAYNEDHPLIAAINQYRRTPMGRHNNRRSNEGMATKTKVSPKELRREAKALGVKGWDEMDVSELKTAIKGAKANGGDSRLAKAKKAAGRDKVKPSKASKDNDKTKKAVKERKGEVEVAENGNPFRPGTNLFLITEELLKGGKRSKMVSRLSKKIELKPRKATKDFDEEAELDRRVLITAQILEKDHGFTKEKDGRGADATIQVTAP